MAADVTKLMDTQSAALIFTDPPYNVDYEGHTKEKLKIKNDKMDTDTFRAFLIDTFRNFYNVASPGAAIYICHADSAGNEFREAMASANWTLKQCLIWVKNQFVIGRQDYQWQHEPVLYGFLQNGKHPWYADRKQTTIWNYDKPKRNANHPTSKPFDLLGYPIGNSSQENAIVIDTFGGSGSTMMACEQMNRMCFTMELDEKYASVILRRAVENGIDPADIYVKRNGEKMMYSDLVKEVEIPDE